MYKHVLHSVSGDLESRSSMTRHVRQSECLYPELTTLDIGGQQMFPHRNLIRVASRNDTPLSNRTAGSRDTRSSVSRMHDVHGQFYGPPTTSTRVTASVVPVSHHPRPSMPNIDAITPSSPPGVAPSRRQDDHSGGNTSPERDAPTTPPAGKRSVLVASPGDSVFDSPECASERRVVKKGRHNHGYDLSPPRPSEATTARKKLFAVHHPVYSPYPAHKKQASGWGAFCCWKPLLICTASLVTLTVLGVVLAIVLDYFDQPKDIVPSMKESGGNSRFKVYNTSVYTGSLTMELSIDGDDTPTGDSLPVSSQELADWLELSLDSILKSSSVGPFYLYSQIIEVRDRVYATEMVFKLYFYHVAGVTTLPVFTLSTVVKLIEEGLRATGSYLPGYRANLNSLHLETTPPEKK